MNTLIKKVPHILLVMLALAGVFFAADYSLGYERNGEVGTVVYKTFLPNYNSNIVKDGPDHYVLIIVQPGAQRGYYLSCPRDYFYDVEIDDKVPLYKYYGRFTGIEYEQNLILN